ncbi:DUF167 domain-containing protein [Candidatus Parcubacteria bacterium]|nr:DUF167 domain-containing protein [Candidatus Parcubacteria bacterium]
MLIKIKVLTKSKKQQVIEKENSADFAYVLEVQVKAKPEQGKANQEVLSLLASHFKAPLKNLKIIRGHKTPNKIIKVLP